MATVWKNGGNRTTISGCMTSTQSSLWALGMMNGGARRPPRLESPSCGLLWLAGSSVSQSRWWASSLTHSLDRSVGRRSVPATGPLP